MISGKTPITSEEEFGRFVEVWKDYDIIAILPEKFPAIMIYWVVKNDRGKDMIDADYVYPEDFKDLAEDE